MDASLSLFGLTVYPFGIFAAVGTLLMLGAMGVLGFLRGLPAGTVRVFGLLGIPLGVVGARLGFCLFNFSLFTETYGNAWLVLNFFDGGLSMTGLLCGLLLAAFLASRLKQARFGDVTDAMSVALGLLIAMLCAGNAFTELGVGKVVQESALTARIPWLFLSQRAGVNVEYRMAVYRYQAMAGVLLFGAMLTLFLCKRGRKAMRTGDLTLVAFSLYGGVQTLLESLRDDGHMTITFLRIAQLAAALMPMLATVILSRRYMRLKQPGDHRVLWTWLTVAVCIVGLVLLEFSLDGRLSWGDPSMGRDYAIMAVLCILLAAAPCSLCYTLHHKLYFRERFQVRVNER